jgi:hypothetical protein
MAYSDTLTDRVGRFKEHHKLDDSARIGFRAVGLKAIPDAQPSNRDLICTATTDGIDTDEEVVVPSGVDLGYYQVNKSNFVDHRYETGFGVGEMRTVKRHIVGGQHRGWINRSMIFSGLRNPLADDIYTIATQGAGIGVSIGFRMIEGSEPNERDPKEYQKAAYIIRKWEWIELSYTLCPANASCRTFVDAQLSPDEKTLSIVDRLITKSSISRYSAAALGFPDRRAYSVTVPVKRLRPLIVTD